MPPLQSTLRREVHTAGEAGAATGSLGSQERHTLGPDSGNSAQRKAINQIAGGRSAVTGGIAYKVASPSSAGTKTLFASAYRAGEQSED